MSQARSPLPNDPTQHVLGGWNPGFGETDDPLGDSLFAPPARPLSRGTGQDDSPALYQDFVIGAAPTGGLEDSLLSPPPPSLRPQMAVSATVAKVAPGTGQTDLREASGGVVKTVKTPQLVSFPKNGEMLGGFRVVSELGRGAFARVYLAEQTELGDRPVALKVSKAEGEEPQMLARLQHTHIVPIHSVHDDPETGQRLMCMPYLGGANLAQVLEAAGERDSHGPDRRSLVRALDEVSQRHQLCGASVVRGASAVGASRPIHFDPDGGDDRARSTTTRSGEQDSSLSAVNHSRGSLTKLHSFFGRFSGREKPAGVGLEGRDFDQPARQFLRKANTIQAAVWIIARLAEGLEHAHSRGLLHRDLKPSNILIAADGTPMLLDFNLSSSTEPGDPAEGEKAMLGGTLPYMSPEHLDAFDPNGSTRPDAVNERSDIYSLGLILFEAIAGAHPFPEPPRRLSLLESIRYQTEQRRKAPSLRRTHPGVPWSLDSIVRKCLDPDPGRRYARARDLADDLNRFLDDLPLRHAPDPSLRERFAKWSRRNPRLCGTTSIAAFSVLLILSLGGLIGLLHGNMQNLSTRLKLQVFRDDFNECRFLLNLGSGPAEHLALGIEKTQHTLDQQRISRSGDWQADSWVRRLTATEQETVREQTAVLILLEARARVFVADRNGNEIDRKKALEWAVPWLDRAEALDPKPPAALFADRARYYSAMGHADLAAIDRRREAQAVPVSSRDFTLLGTARLARGDIAAAEPALLRAVELDPRGFWSWFALGHCHFEQGRYLDAAGDFTACVVLEPKFAWPHMNRGLALARVGRLNEARGEYDRALEANPRFAEAWLNLALVDLELNDLPAAERALHQTWSLGRRESGVMAVWAEVKARLGHRDEAEELFTRLLTTSPDDPVLLPARGIFRLETDPAAAEADFRQALRINPRSPRAHYGMALLLRRQSPDAALVEADAALAADPNFLDALQLRALLRARIGDVSAVDDAERLIQIPTPHRLYNAACALALLVEKTGETRFANRALALLSRAIDAGFPAAHAAADPDLTSLHSLPRFREMVGLKR